jgi:hypothetical protein
MEFKDLLPLSLGLRSRGASLQAALLKPCNGLYMHMLNALLSRTLMYRKVL